MSDKGKVAIANLAFTRLGEETIKSFTEDSEQARAASSLWDLTRDFVLAEHSWGFAKALKSLGKLTEVPPFKWTAYFQKPEDFIRTISVYPRNTQFEIYGSKIASNTSTMDLEYVRREDNTAIWSAGFLYAFSSKFEADVSYKLTNKTTLYKQKMDVYNNIDLPKAKAIDSQSQNIPASETSDWVSSRY